MKKENLNVHSSMVGKIVFTIDDNKFYSGRVTRVDIVSDEKNTMIHYLVKEHNSNEEYRFYHKDCYTSMQALINDLKKTFEESKLALAKERKQISGAADMSFLNKN